jgi:hypothetical protein
LTNLPRLSANQAKKASEVIFGGSKKKRLGIDRKPDLALNRFFFFVHRADFFCSEIVTSLFLCLADYVTRQGDPMFCE